MAASTAGLRPAASEVDHLVAGFMEEHRVTASTVDRPAVDSTAGRPAAVSEEARRAAASTADLRLMAVVDLTGAAMAADTGKGSRR